MIRSHSLNLSRKIAPVVGVCLSLCQALLAVSILSPSAFARTIIDDTKISIAGDSGYPGPESLRSSVSSTSVGNIFDHMNSNTDTLSKNTECAEILEVPGTFLCIPMYQMQMNEIFLRPAFYWGTQKGFPKKTLVSNQNLTLKNYQKLTQRNNLPGNIINEFYKAALATKDPSKKLIDAEMEFYKHFLQDPRIKALGDHFYVIAVSVQNTGDYHETVNHEIHHAKYYLESDFKAKIDQFWKEQISDSDKRDIRDTLGVAYNSADENAMIDEFQAYMLESDSGIKRNWLTSYSSLYREPLLNYLEATPVPTATASPTPTQEPVSK